MRNALLLFIFYLYSFATFGQSGTITFIDGNCFDVAPGTTLSYVSASGCPSRNTYSGIVANGGNTLTIQWSSPNNRWEVILTAELGCGVHDYLVYYNTFASAPNPPSLGTGTWVNVPITNCFETIACTIDALSGSGTQNNIGTTCSSNPSVNLSVSTTTGTEVGTTVVTVTATASAAVSGAQTLSLAVTGTNITVGDYTLSNTTITIPNGQTMGTATFTIVDDALVEGKETATLTISNPSSGITLGGTTTQNIEITDNDVACTYTPSDITVSGFGCFGPGGTYSPNGTVNGAPSWKSAFNFEIVWSSTNSRWEIIGGGETWSTNSTGSITNLPCSTGWTDIQGCASGTITLSGGCGSLLPPTVTPSVSIAANPGNSITTGTSVTFTATPTNGGTTPAYQWKKNGNNVGTNSVTYSDAALANNDVIICSLTSNNPCASPTTATSSSITMAVTNPCTPTTSTTTISNCGSYVWNGTTYSTSGTYTKTLVNAGGCDSTATLVLTVNNSVTPSVTITSNPTMPIAVGTNVIFTAVPTNGGPGITYAWYKNALKLSDTDSILQNASVEDEDTIKCVITSNAACVTTTTAESNKIVVVEIPVCATPTKFSVTGGGVYCAGGSGLAVGLSSSEVGVNYQLLIPSPKNPNQWATLNLPVAGTGSAINFGNYTAATSYRVLAKSAVGGCQDTMNGKATITTTTMAIWTGNSSNDLANAANIDGCALSSSVDLQIASGLSVYPIVIGSVSAKSVTIQAGATLTVSGKLNVSGSFTNNGTPSIGSGNIVLNGTTGTISGSSVFNNLKIAGNYTIGNTEADKVEVTGILSLESGAFTTNAKLTLKSSATKTALIQENGGSISGNINMERYVGGSAGYHHLSSPVSNNTVATWGKYFNIVGKDGLRSGTKGFTPATLQEYRESANTKALLDSGYYNYTNSDAVIANGKGLSAWFVKVPTTIVSTGNATSGTVTVPVTFAGINATTKGWNLIGNPYPSPISWSALRSLNPGVWGDQACYIWKATKGVNGQWQTYNGTVGTNGVGNVIASSQAFFVLVNQSTNLTFNNSIRTSDVNPTFFGSAQLKQLRLQIVNPANLAETDEVVAYTKAGITTPVASVKPPMPAEATNASLSFVHEGKQAAIEALADFKAGDELALNISTPVAGVYLLKVGEYNNSLPAYLKDAKTGSYTELKAGTEIAVATEATTSNTRYSVVFGRPAAAVASANNTYKVFAAKKAIQVTNSVAVNYTKVVVYNTLGQQIATATMNGTSLSIPVSASTNATYVVKIAGETVAKVIVP